MWIMLSVIIFIYAEKSCKGGHSFACYHQGVLQFNKAINGGVLTEEPTPAQQKKCSSEKCKEDSSKKDKKETKTSVSKPLIVDKNLLEVAKSTLEKNCKKGEMFSCQFLGGIYLSQSNM